MYHVQKALLIFIFSLSIPLLAREVVWEGFYDMSDQAEAERTSLKSSEPMALKKAGLYYLSISHGAMGTKIEKKNLMENARKAVKYLERAYKLDRKNPVLRTWVGTANLALAGISSKLTHRIKYSNRGISHLNAIFNEGKDNLNYLAMLVISFTPVPKSFRNMTSRVLESGRRYLEILDKNKNSLNGYQLDAALALKEAVFVSMAYVENILKNKDEARRLFSQVDEKLLLVGNSKGSSAANNFYSLKKEF